MVRGSAGNLGWLCSKILSNSCGFHSGGKSLGKSFVIIQLIR